MKIKIIEVGARDGLQNEMQALSVKDRYDFIKKLCDSGLKIIEAGAFVSPKWVPQMDNSNKVLTKLFKDQTSGKINSKIQFPMLVPNMKGFQRAMDSQTKEIAIFGACSESFSQKNINCSINQSFGHFKAVINAAKKNNVKVRAYLSVAFGCPYEGKVSEQRVIKLTEKLIQLGAYEVSIGDTIGVATPKQVRSLVNKLGLKIPLKKVAMHFHDTRGTALANVLASLDLGIHTFDSSLGGLGGCPYAKGASGNLATEDLVYMLEGMGHKTGVDISKLIKINKWIENKVGHQLPSHVGKTESSLYK
ncbi:MAG: hydroxymethylglutaryl-CoA lyase [Bdellovibrionaceae bacterium]|jgi:hydroxymethylglutaryl-CoA lyase|nr:hydroxymethylglutaryl-CoA lyase [Pseudobdellovibrionaceae bacterium]